MESLASRIELRAAAAEDLPAINGVIERAVMTWTLPERVRRLSLPTYRYDEHDLITMDVVVAEARDDGIIGVAAWEDADAAEVPEGARGLLLHGLYVEPYCHSRGVGTRLLGAAEAAARERGAAGVLARARPEAEAFFAKRGFSALPVAAPARDYPHRFWKPVSRSPAAAPG